jgi:hypothetical protein
MKGIAIGAAALALLLAGCEQSHARNSSGSNWLRCDTLADCSAAEQAVACDDDGFCRDADGERIAETSGPGPTGGRDGGPAGGRNAPEPVPQDACVWGVDALLAEVGADAAGRFNCGLFNSAQTASIETAVECFENAVAASRTAELTVNRCIDCQIPTTYVASTGGELYAILLEADTWGDSQRHARVETCEAVVWDDEAQDVSCVGPAERYDCSGSFPVPEETPPDPSPVEPLKIADVPAPAGADTAPLHLYVSNQSFENDLVQIDVFMNGTRVVTGDFPVGSQHNWYEFDIEVPVGTLSVRAIGIDGNADLGQQIEVPAERWVVIDYWFYPDEAEGEHFTLAVHDQPVTFD